MTKRQRKRILITGGAGFLGSHLCEALLNLGHDVLCLDNLQTSSKNNIRHLLGNQYFEFILHDIIEPIRLEVDEIYNLACPASPIHYQTNPIATIKSNVLGAINVLGIAKRNNATVFQASTSEVYGDPLEHPQKESYWGNVNPIGPRSCYDEGKRVAETLFFDYHRAHGVDIRVVRIFNTYGPRMSLNDGRVVSNFIIQALTGQGITIFGEGNQTRSFCYVDDLINGCLSMMNQEKEIGPINLGNPNEITIKELAQQIISLTNSKSKIVYKPLPQDDPTQRNPDITLALETLNFSPQTAISEGLEKTINYFRHLINN